MKHSYSISLCIRFHQLDYCRGESLMQWIISTQWGIIKPWNSEELHRLGGHEKRLFWARITVAGISFQINIEHSISNWSRTKTRRIDEQNASM